MVLVSGGRRFPVITVLFLNREVVRCCLHIFLQNSHIIEI